MNNPNDPDQLPFSIRNKPQGKIRQGEPLLCLDMDGVLAPMNHPRPMDRRNQRGYDGLAGFPEWFRQGSNAGVPAPFHPRMPEWCAELLDIFDDNFCWFSYRDDILRFSHKLGFRKNYPILTMVEQNPEPLRRELEQLAEGMEDRLLGFEGEIIFKTESVIAHIDPSTPICLIDDLYAYEFYNDAELDATTNAWSFIKAWEAPVQLIAPADHIGIYPPVIESIRSWKNAPENTSDNRYYSRDAELAWLGEYPVDAPVPYKGNSE